MTDTAMSLKTESAMTSGHTIRQQKNSTYPIMHHDWNQCTGTFTFLDCAIAH